MWCLYGWLAVVAASPQPLPPVRWIRNGTQGAFVLSKVPKTIYIDDSFSAVSDKNGLTLIPPTAWQFAEIFRQDISQWTQEDWEVERVDSFPESGIFLGQYGGEYSQVTYENGMSSEEGYELEVGDGTVFIGGTGARGMFWGTRTLLQELAIAENYTLQAGRSVDAPAYATRGYMLDAGRKWYSGDFLKELCTYASFFKMSEFHYHSSDNYPLNRGHNETW